MYSIIALLFILATGCATVVEVTSSDHGGCLTGCFEHKGLHSVAKSSNGDVGCNCYDGTELKIK